MTISGQLREAIERSGESRYAIAQATGVNQAALSRFVRGQSGLTSDSIDKLAAYLGLELTAAKSNDMPGNEPSAHA